MVNCVVYTGWYYSFTNKTRIVQKLWLLDFYGGTPFETYQSAIMVTPSQKITNLIIFFTVDTSVGDNDPGYNGLNLLHLWEYSLTLEIGALFENKYLLLAIIYRKNLTGCLKLFWEIYYG